MEFSENWWEKLCAALRGKGSNWWALNLCRYCFYSKPSVYQLKNHLDNHACVSGIWGPSQDTLLWSEEQAFLWGTGALHELRTSCGNGEILLLGFKHIIIELLLCQTLISCEGMEETEIFMSCCPVNACFAAGVAGSGRGQDCTENAGRDQPCRFAAWNHQRRLLCGSWQVRGEQTTAFSHWLGW